MAIMDYADWVDELEKFVERENIDVKNYHLSQKRMDIHMQEYSMKFMTGDPNRMKQLISENREYMHRYTRTLDR